MLKSLIILAIAFCNTTVACEDEVELTESVNYTIPKDGYTSGTHTVVIRVSRPDGHVDVHRFVVARWKSPMFGGTFPDSQAELTSNTELLDYQDAERSNLYEQSQKAMLTAVTPIFESDSGKLSNVAQKKLLEIFRLEYANRVNAQAEVLLPGQLRDDRDAKTRHYFTLDPFRAVNSLKAFSDLGLSGKQKEKIEELRNEYEAGKKEIIEKTKKRIKKQNQRLSLQVVDILNSEQQKGLIDQIGVFDK